MFAALLIFRLAAITLIVTLPSIIVVLRLFLVQVVDGPPHIIDVERVAQLGAQVLVALLPIIGILFLLDFVHLFVQVFNLIHNLLGLGLEVVLDGSQFLGKVLLHRHVDRL